MIRRIFLCLSVVAMGVLPLVAGAQTPPSVVSFTASPSTINSGQYVAFAWDLSDAGGYSFLVPCVPGVKVKYTNGTVLPCGTPLSTTQIVDDSLLLSILNVSGGVSTLTIRITPKDPGGVDISGESRTVSVSVGTAPRPITSFTTSLSSATNTTISETPLTLSWTSDLPDGVNLSVECNNNLSITSPSYNNSASSLPCATPIFSSDLTPSGSLTLLFSNKSITPQPLTVTLLPTIASRIYDGGHAERIDLIVASDVLPDPVITSFTVAPTVVASDEAVTVSWVVENAKGVNMKIGCLDSLTASSTILGTPLLSCSTLALASPLPVKGSYGFYFHNTAKFDQTETITLLPSQKSGFYDGVHTRSVQVTVRPASSGAPPPTLSPSALPPVSNTSSSPAIISPAPPPLSPATSARAPVFFTKILRRGSSGVEVSALQRFLKQSTTIYPEGIVNGVFGPATERAVQRFQKKYSIVSSGTPLTTGFGATGPKTRQKLNTLTTP